MTRAEEAAFKAYPPLMDYYPKVPNSTCVEFCPTITDYNTYNRLLFKQGYEQAEKDLINRIRKQVKTWMPERDGDEHTEGERLAFNSVLHLLKELEDKK